MNQPRSTIDSKVYGDLLAQYQPKILMTEAENERALSVVELLANKNDLTPEEEQISELLIALIEFEAEHYPPKNISTPISRLTFLREQNNLRQADLIEVFGSKGIVSEVISGKHQISKSHAIKLGEFFHLNPSLFLL